MDNTLMEVARRVVENKSGRTPLGILTPEDKVLIVFPPEQDQEVLDIVKEALKEKGIEADSVGEHELMGISLADLAKHNAAEGWKELIYFSEGMADFLGIPPAGRTCWRSWTYLKPFLDKNPKYTAVYMGMAAENFYRRYIGEHSHKFKALWWYINKEYLCSNMMIFPDELFRTIEHKTTELIPQVAEIRVADPQGTYLECFVTEEESRLWAQTIQYNPPSHIAMHPIQTHMLLSLRGLWNEKWVLAPKTNGVLAGTCGHYGFYPHMKAFIKDGVVDRIEGGGKMGDLLQGILARTRDVQYPGFPKPGYLYFNEVALGTHPKGFQPQEDIFSDTYASLPTIHQRNRSGVIHWGMGVERHTAEFIKFAKENKLPFEHSWHFHTYFNTYEVRLRGSNEWIKIIDNGHLTALDDPSVRSVASKYGDADKLLKEEWIPQIPGINYPGDYMRDYGRDPVSWVWKESKGLLPKTVGVI